MAQLRNLGQPFGSPGGIINVPAPSGSALAGQIQMQSMQGLGQALGAYLGQQKQNKLWQQDQPALQNYFQNMMAEQQPGFTGPPQPFPQMQSRRGQGVEQMVTQAQIGSMFRDPLDRELKQARIGALKRPEKMGTVDQRLRAGEAYIDLAEATYGEERDDLTKRAKEILDGALDKMDPKDTSKTGTELKERAGKIRKKIIKMAKGRPEFGEMDVFERLAPKKIEASYMRPTTPDQFISTIEKMKAAGNMKQARAFYNKWRDKIKW